MRSTHEGKYTSPPAALKTSTQERSLASPDGGNHNMARPLARLILGTGSADSLLGGDGHDIVLGLAGDDSLDSGAGRDVVLGGAGQDFIIGGDGGDWIQGGTGNDTVIGDRISSDGLSDLEPG